jgi:hypothetical protein
MVDEARFVRAVAAIDAANADDPNGKELRHAELATGWVKRLRPDASEALLLAARAHHLRRWAIPRHSYPDGRNGYLRWRKALQKNHAADVGRILAAEGYDASDITRVQDIVQKRRLTSDADVQAFEDALCLVFLEDQLDELGARLDAEKSVDVLRKTLDKMSAEGIRLAMELDLSAGGRALLSEAAALPPGARSR